MFHIPVCHKDDETLAINLISAQFLLLVLIRLKGGGILFHAVFPCRLHYVLIFLYSFVLLSFSLVLSLFLPS
jgi:hypothetical protein